MPRARAQHRTSTTPGDGDLAVGDAGMPAVTVRGLVKRYGRVAAVDGLTFELPRGSITGFLGPNGAGKSTTMRLLLGLATPTAGQALVFGRRYVDLARPSQRVGAVLESGDFDPGRSGRNHLRALALAADLPFQRVDDVLAVVGLRTAADRTVRTFSLGMRQRLGLAGALLGEPELLILDEPANGLDPQGIHWLREFLRDFAAGGGTVLLSSHVLPEVAQTATAVVIMHRGRRVATFGPDELAGGGRLLEERYLQATREDLP